MTKGAELDPAQTGELRADGTFVVARTEKPNGWTETHRVGKLKIRGEREPRTINYNDYAKLLTFWNTQERLIKDRKHIMVALSDGLVVNTADITSLEPEDVEKFISKTAEIEKKLGKLPTEWIKYDHPDEPGYFCEALVHYSYEHGRKIRHTNHDEIKELRKMRRGEDGQPIVCQVYKYGIPQL